MQTNSRTFRPELGDTTSSPCTFAQSPQVTLFKSKQEPAKRLKGDRFPLPTSHHWVGCVIGTPPIASMCLIIGWSCQDSLVDLPSSPLPCRPVLPHGLSGRLAPSTSYSPSWLTLFTWLTCLLLILIAFHLVLPDKGHRNQGVEGWLSQALVTKVGEVSLANLQTF